MTKPCRNDELFVTSLNFKHRKPKKNIKPKKILFLHHELSHMTDVHSKATRSYNMSRIKSKNTKPELLVRKYLFKHGFRYRVNVKKLPGTPDVVLPKYKTVIFIHGCFWHGHDHCKYYVLPKTRTEWWKNKIEGNKQRDTKVREELRHMGWRTMVVWECQLKTAQKTATLEAIVSALNQAFLDKHRIKPKTYPQQDDHIPMVAENSESYLSSPPEQNLYPEI